MLEQFKTIILNSKSGKIIGARFNQAYFESHGASALWNQYTEATQHLHHMNDKIHKFRFLDAGYDTLQSIPKCHCGELVKVLDGKISKSCSVRCALSSPFRSAAIKESLKSFNRVEAHTKRSSTMLLKYGVEFNSQRNDIHHIWEKSKLSSEIENKLKDKIWMHEEYNIKQRSGVDIAAELNCYYGTVISYCIQHGFTIRKRSNYSLVEVEVTKYLDSLNIEYIHSDWDTLNTLELDIIIPSKKIAIEIDGLYWHSLNKQDESKKNKERHIIKTKMTNEQGYELIHITDHEWKNKQDIVKNILRSKLGLNKVIGARSCDIKEVDAVTAKAFLIKYHIQGFAAAKVNYGLFSEGKLVSIATFGKPRFNKKYDWELIRLASAEGITVIGGLSKLLAKFKSEQSGSLISYCDLRYSSGNAYVKVGFEHIGSTSPGYFWTDGNDVISRYKSQKTNLAKWLVTYDPELSEATNMFNAGYKRFWDCGQAAYTILNSNLA